MFWLVGDVLLGELARVEWDCRGRLGLTLKVACIMSGDPKMFEAMFRLMVI